LRDHFVEC